MSIHILLIGLIVGFAIVAALSARGMNRKAAMRWATASSHLNSVWTYGMIAACFATLVVIASKTKPSGDLMIDATALYPWLALLLIAGSYTICWYHFDTKNYHQTVRILQREKTRTARRKARARR